MSTTSNEIVINTQFCVKLLLLQLGKEGFVACAIASAPQRQPTAQVRSARRCTDHYAVNLWSRDLVGSGRPRNSQHEKRHPVTIPRLCHYPVSRKLPEHWWLMTETSNVTWRIKQPAVCGSTPRCEGHYWTCVIACRGNLFGLLRTGSYRAKLANRCTRLWRQSGSARGASMLCAVHGCAISVQVPLPPAVPMNNT